MTTMATWTCWSPATAASSCYRNKGDGTFEDVTAKAGLKIPGWSIGAAWLDYDRDGCVDLFVGRYVKFDPEYRAYYPADNYPGPLDYPAETNVLLHNNCDGTFSDVTAKAGNRRAEGRAMGVTAADFDRDGYPDIYVANDKSENFLLHNQKDGTFKEIATQAGVAFGQNGENTSPWDRCSPISITRAGGVVSFPIPSTTACTGIWAV